MAAILSARERFLRTLRYEPVDRRPLYLAGPWPDTLARWRREGLPENTDPHVLLGVAADGYRIANLSPLAGLYPPFVARTLRQEGNEIIELDAYGRTVRGFVDQTSMPEWLDVPVKCAADLRRLLDEHFDVSDLDARFPADWAASAQAAAARGDLLLVDGGCYYWTLRSVAGVDGASLLLYDAPELVDELCERYFTVVMEGLRRASRLVQLDLIGFGEDFAFKTGPLLSPAMFRRFIAPRYRKTMALARECGVTLAWHDSDGDCRQLLPDMLAAGVNGTVPCEVAAGMDPVELRRHFGRALRLGGGVDKRLVAAGPEASRRELARLAPVIRAGGYVPGIDHSVPADVSWDHYRAYIEALQQAALLV